MIITFSGVSGSGKSTIIHFLKRNELFRGRKIKIRNEDSFVTIKILKKIIGQNLFSQYKEEKFFKTQNKNKIYGLFKDICYIFYPIVVYIEFLIDHLFYEKFNKNCILFVDKFIYDHLVQFKLILGIDNIFVRWLYNTYPRPYLSFFIDINLENAALVRNKNNIHGKITSKKSFHKRAIASYHLIAIRKHLLTIDSNGKIQNAVSMIVEHIKNKEKLLNAKKISISGLDGTGKTTVINLLEEYAKKLNIKYKTVHFIHNNLLYKILLFLGYYDLDKPRAVIYKMSRQHSARERIRKTSFIKVFLRFFDSYIQYIYYVIFNESQLILFDRYFYDYLVSFEYLQIRWRPFFNYFIPSIRNKFLFVVSPQISYRRKPERVKAFFVECDNIYQKMANREKLVIVRTDNKNPRQILQEVLRSII